MAGVLTAESPAPPDAAFGRWSRDANWLDWLVVGVTLVVAAVTIWLASAPVVGSMGVLMGLGLIWPVAAVGWAVSIFRTVRSDAGRRLAVILLVGAGLGISGLVPGFLTVLFGGLAIVAGIGLGLGLFAALLVVEQKRRVVWLVAPAVVLATIALSISGLPRWARFELAQPALTAYATELLAQGPVAFPEEGVPFVVGGIPVEWADVRDGCARLVTGYVGILDDIEAGLAYCPAAVPKVLGSFQPISGNWYRFSGVGFD